MRAPWKLESDETDRFARFRLISWWDQDRLRQAKIVLIGAGALGNEILKDLALLGVGQVFLADLDRVENSNLSRSILFRAEDCGRPKVEAAAQSAQSIYPEMRIQPFHGNVVYDLGLGVFHWADVILGGLDNREARVAINLAAARTGKVWIDGAIERLDGVARVFDPATGPCYECTMSDVDWKMLAARRSCALLTRQQMMEGHVPTTPTTASIIAGIQCQEAIKLIHGLPTLAGQGFVFDGTNHESYKVTYSQKEDCLAHEPFDPIVPLPNRVNDTTLGELLEIVRSDLGAAAVVESNQDLLKSLECQACGVEDRHLGSLGKATEALAQCPKCHQHRVPHFHRVFDGKDETLLDLHLSELGIPSWEILCGRVGMKQRFYEFQGDRDTVLGCLAEKENAAQ